MRSARLLALATLFVVAFLTQSSAAQTTAFTYQGQLNISGSPANGSYDFEFRLFGQSSGGSQLGPTETRSSLSVANGNFTVTLDFGAQFPGAARFLEIKVGAAPGGATTFLTPRQQIYSAPYSIKSLNADQLGGLGTAGFIQNTTVQQLSSNFNISGSGVTGGPMSSQQFLLPATGQGILPGLIKRDANHVGLCGVNTPGGAVLGCPVEIDLTNVNTGTTVTIASPLIVEDEATFQQAASVTGSLTVGNQLTVNGNTTFNANVVLNAPAGVSVNHLCLTPGNLIGICSSSMRYKTNITPYVGNLDVVNRLNPVAFNWKEGGMKDVGLLAEDVAKVDPRFVTYNSKGQIEGINYDRLSAVFVNAFKQQEALIEDGQKQIREQKAMIEKQQAELTALKALVCSKNSSAEICKR